MRVPSNQPLFLVFLGALLWLSATVAAQTPAKVQAQKKVATTVRRPGPLIVEKQPGAPQVVTILHRLTGLKLFRLLLHSEGASVIEKLDDAFKVNGDVHTTVIAGLALPDGQTIAARLPEVEAEIGATLPAFGLKEPVRPSTPKTPPKAPSPAVSAMGTFKRFLETPDVTIVTRDGQRITAHYIGFDGVTGLSVMKLTDKGFPHVADVPEQAISTGQRLRLLGPEPVPQAEANTGTIYVRMGEAEGTIVDITRAPSGGIVRVRLRSSKLSAANIGGIALNDAGQTVGIVNAIEGSEATILPAALVESAAKRVLERQASVPRPWLGIRGESLLQPDQLIHRGWEVDKATSLFEDHRGILLTSVAPGSPAALAMLRAGDVLLRVNDAEVRNADDLSWFLEEAKPGSSVRFTVARPEQFATEAVDVKLSESPDPFRSAAMPEVRAARMAAAGSVLGLLIEQGIETIAMRPRVASRFGAAGGLLIVYVQSASPAFESGLRSGDVIEAIDGQPISFSSKLIPKSDTTGRSYSFSIVRNREKLTIKLATSAK